MVRTAFLAQEVERRVRLLGGGAVLWLACVAPVVGQTAWASPTAGPVTFTANVDVPSVYVFRGIVQERDPRLTTCPSADVGIALASGDGALPSVGANLGTWHSLHGGSSGSSGPSGQRHYEEDFPCAGGAGPGQGLRTALMSPAGPR